MTLTLAGCVVMVGATAAGGGKAPAGGGTKSSLLLLHAAISVTAQDISNRFNVCMLILLR
jgi:hypothetical protein